MPEFIKKTIHQRCFIRFLNISSGFEYIRVLNILQSSLVLPTLLTLARHPIPPTLAHQPPYPCCHTTNGLSPIITNDVFNFQENESYNLRSGIHLASRNTHTAHFGINTISSLGHKLWKLVPDKTKNASALSAFKAKIKSWTTNNCQCKLCKIFVGVIGFVEVFPSL